MNNLMAILLGMCMTSSSSAGLNSYDAYPNIVNENQVKIESQEKIETEMRAKVISCWDGNILVSDINDEKGGLYIISADSARKAEGNIKNGAIVDIGYYGGIQETYPAGIIDVDYIKVKKQEEDMVSVYMELFNKLYDEGDFTYSKDGIIALDLTKVKNLSESEKEALAYLIEREYNKETRLATFSQLKDEGYIKGFEKDDYYPYFSKGVLFTFKTTDVGLDNFKFSDEKWISADGAIGHSDCSAEKINGKWRYEYKSRWIA